MNHRVHVINPDLTLTQVSERTEQQIARLQAEHVARAASPGEENGCRFARGGHSN